MWAKKNESYIQKKVGSQVLGIRINTVISFFLQLFRILFHIPSSSPDSLKKQSQATAEAKRKRKDDKERSRSSCLLYDKMRLHLEDGSSWFNSVMKGMIVLNVLLFALNSANASQTLQSTVYYGNISFCGFFCCELVFRLIVIGPGAYLDDPLYLLDSIMIVLGLFSLRYPDAGFQFVTIFRVLFLLKTKDEALRSRPVDIANTAFTIADLIAIVKKCISAVIVYLVLLCALIYVVAILSMFILPPFCETILKC